MKDNKKWGKPFKKGQLPHNFIDLSGKVFNNLLVLEKGISVSYWDKQRKIKRPTIRKWKVKCLLCNKIFETVGQNIREGRTKSCRNCGNRINIKQSAINSIFNRYKAGAKTRGINFELTKKELAWFLKKPCYYCNKRIQNTYTNPNTKEIFKYNGIDRLDSNKGYIKDNLVACCGTCNIMKLDWNKEDFLKKIKQIFNNRIERR